MNPQAQAQLTTLLFGTGGIIAAILVKYGVPDGLASQICQLLAVVVPTAVGYWLSRSKTSDQAVAQSAATLDPHAVIAATANIPGVQSITIDKSANGPAAAAAANPNLPNVQKAV